MPTYPPGGRPQVTVSEVSFAEAEAKGAVRLDLRYRKQINRALSHYALARYLALSHYAAQEQINIKHFARRLKRAIDLMATSDVIKWAVGSFGSNRLTENRATGNEREFGQRELERLQALRRWLVGFQDEMVWESNRPVDAGLSELLLALEAIYLKAGGQGTGVSRILGTDQPTSPFVDFIIPLLSQLPEYMRPRTDQVIASTRERL